ncbi:MAG TPA: D-aminoacyl-tRNA deacylase [Vicinamibacterales bacterium]
MRAIVQRVTRASVTVNGDVSGAIGPGLLALIGVANEDGPADVQYIADKIRGLRVFADEEGRMNRSVADIGGALLVVSQFTLQADCRKGRRPSLDAAAPPALARALFDAVVGALRESGLRVETGVFQADMQVELVNDGPVTILLDSTRIL